MQHDSKNVEQGVDGDKKHQHAWQNVERGLYKDVNTGQYYERIRSGGNTWLSLETAKLPEARERLDAHRMARAAHKLGLKVKDPKKKSVTVNDVLDRFEADEYPNRSGHARKDLTQPKFAIPFLREYFGEMPVADLKHKTLDDYHEWRIKQVAKGDGHRTTDLDIQTLSVALNWARRKNLISSNPIEKHPRYTDPDNVRHAKDKAPEDMEIVHKLAAEFFTRPNSEVLGWQLLFAAMTGQRTEELLSLRTDAGPEEPGWLTKDGGTLHVRRVKKAGRENPSVFVHDELRQLLAAHSMWKATRYPDCPWFFPGRNGKSVLSEGALANALRGRKQQDEKGKKKQKKTAVTKTLLSEMRGKLTPHGLRALYVKVRRSNGIPDNQIAWELNHTSGVATLEDVYGGIPPHWVSGNGPKLTWIPGVPAWKNI